MKISFTIDGDPKGKGRPRMCRAGHTYTPRETAVYENLVRMEYRRQCGENQLDGQMRAVIKAYYSMPRSASKTRRDAMLQGKERPTKKPDLDNVAKIILDSLNGLAYYDDKNVVDLKIEKWWSDEPRVEVELEEIRG